MISRLTTLHWTTKNGTHPSLEVRQVGTRIVEYCCDRPDCVWGENGGRTMYRDVSGLFYRNLEDKNVESTGDDGVLAYEFQRGAKTLPGHVYEESMVFGQPEQKKLL